MVCVRPAAAWTSAQSSASRHTPPRRETHTHRHQFPSFLPLFFFGFYLCSPFLSRSFQSTSDVPSDIGFHLNQREKKKYLTERYIKREHSEFLTFFAQLLQNEQDGEARKSNSKSGFFLCLFAAFSLFPLSGRWRLAQGHNSFILIHTDSVQGHENEIGTAKLILRLFYSAKLKKDNPFFSNLKTKHKVKLSSTCQPCDIKYVASFDR